MDSGLGRNDKNWEKKWESESVIQKNKKNLLCALLVHPPRNIQELKTEEGKRRRVANGSSLSRFTYFEGVYVLLYERVKLIDSRFCLANNRVYGSHWDKWYITWSEHVWVTLSGNDDEMVWSRPNEEIDWQAWLCPSMQ